MTETSAPENEFQLIVKVQTKANNTDDAAMLAEVLPELRLLQPVFIYRT